MSNAVLGRRVFLGSAGAAAIAGFGALNLPLAAQPAPPADPLIRELYRQLKLGMGKMLDGEGEGARQLASTLRIYAMTVSDDEIRANLRAATRARGRQALLDAPADHASMQQLGRQLGIPLSLLPPHVAPDTVRRD